MGAFNNLNELSQFEQTAVWFVSLAGVLAGIWIIYSNPQIKTDFDKREGMVKITKSSFLKNKTKSYSLSDVKDIVITESKDDEGSLIFSVELKTFNGKSESLTKTWLRNKEELDKIVEQIKDFLKKQLNIS